MHWIREFSQRRGPARERNVEDAPFELRNELVDFFFYLADESQGRLQPLVIYEATGLMLGVGIAANPMATYRARVSRDIRNAEWPRVFDWISRLWPEFDGVQLADEFINGVNTLLAAYGVVWELDGMARWVRVLAEPLRQQVTSAFVELDRAGFEPSRQLFVAATDAFNARPRRDRDACANIYDALESVAKIVYQMQNATFGQVLDRVRQRGTISEPIQRLLRDVEVMRHNAFGHGMAEPFALSAAEVDFVYAACAAAIPVFTRQ
jgi:hypothetical protein